MDIAERLERAVKVGMERIPQQDQRRITDLNDKFDALLKQGLVVEDRYNLAMNGAVRSQQHPAKR